MSVIIEQSVCKDCEGLSTCQRLRRLNPVHTIRDDMEKLYEGVDTGTISGALLYRRQGRKKEIFKIIISECSMKEQYEIRKQRGNVEHKEEDMLYYCNYCKTMHRIGSEIGLSHKNISDNIWEKK